MAQERSEEAIEYPSFPGFLPFTGYCTRHVLFYMQTPIFLIFLFRVFTLSYTHCGVSRRKSSHHGAEFSSVPRDAISSFIRSELDTAQECIGFETERVTVSEQLRGVRRPRA